MTENIISVRIGTNEKETIPVFLSEVKDPEPGFLTMQLRMLAVFMKDIEPKKTSQCIGPMISLEEKELPWYLSDPYNVGVMCRVVDFPGQKKDPNRPSRLFSEIFASISKIHRTWLCPTWILRSRFGTKYPQFDPLHTLSNSFKPWIWEGCIPYTILASMNPSNYGFIGRNPLKIAISRTTENQYGQVVETWQQTKTLIERSFDRSRAGYFDFSGERYPYVCEAEEPRGMSIFEAGKILQLEASRASQGSIRTIEQNYYQLYSQVDPSQVDAEQYPELWQYRTEQAKLLTEAYNRVLLERMIQSRPISSLPSRERALAVAALALIVTVDTSELESENIFKIIFKKSAPRVLGLKDKTIKYYYNDQNQLEVDFETMSKNLRMWIDALYIQPYISKGHYPKIEFRGLEE